MICWKISSNIDNWLANIGLLIDKHLNLLVFVDKIDTKHWNLIGKHGNPELIDKHLIERSMN